MYTLIKCRDKLIAVLIYFFTYLNFLISKKVVYHLSFRGFYSEINNLLFAIIYLKEKNKEIIVDSSRFCYSYKNGITDYFNLNYETVDFDEKKFINFRKNKLNNYLFSEYYFKNYLFKKIRKNNFREDRLKELPVLMKKEMREIYGYNKETQEKIAENIKNLNLPSDYVSFHIRRGDKVWGEFKEADFVELDEYFKKLNKFIKSDKKINLYVATDDEKVISEIRKRHPEVNLYSLYSSENVRETEADFLMKSRESVKEHTLNLLTEVEILINSRYFVGSFSSNLGRFVGASVGLENCASVDLSWDSIH